VKTRLALDIGPEAAAAIYRCMVQHQISAITPEWRVEIHFAPAVGADEMRQWLGLRHVFHSQAGNDLGGRLVHATAGAFSRGAGAVIVIGGDCPGLDDICLRRASSALDTTDVVLGPTVDGGYYLIGLRRMWPSLFRDIHWCSDAVLKQTMERVREASLSHAVLSIKEDVDDITSWRRVSTRLPTTIAMIRLGETSS
jgi:hypothetical protein